MLLSGFLKMMSMKILYIRAFSFLWLLQLLGNWTSSRLNRINGGKSVRYFSGKAGLEVAFYRDILPSGERKDTESVQEDYTGIFPSSFVSIGHAKLLA